MYEQQTDTSWFVLDASFADAFVAAYFGHTSAAEPGMHCHQAIQWASALSLGQLPDCDHQTVMGLFVVDGENASACPSPVKVEQRASVAQNSELKEKHAHLSSLGMEQEHLSSFAVAVAVVAAVVGAVAAAAAAGNDAAAAAGDDAAAGTRDAAAAAAAVVGDAAAAVAWDVAVLELVV